MKEEKYVKESLELHVLFIKIMEDYAIFLETGLSLKKKSQIKKVNYFKKEFEALLLQVSNMNTISLEDKLEEDKLIEIEKINSKILKLLDEFINFKRNILKDIRLGRLEADEYKLIIEYIVQGILMYRKELLWTELEREFENLVYKTKVFTDKVITEFPFFIEEKQIEDENTIILILEE